MRKSSSSYVVVAVLLTSGCQIPLDPPSRTTAAPGEVQFEVAGAGGAAVVVPVKVNGTGPHPFVLDTGATLTCVDDQLASQLELEAPVGRIGFGAGVGAAGQVRLVSIESLEVGDARATDLTGCALDLQAIKGAGLEVSGLLGLNFLKQYRVTLDFAAQSLKLETPHDTATR